MTKQQRALLRYARMYRAGERLAVPYDCEEAWEGIDTHAIYYTHSIYGTPWVGWADIAESLAYDGRTGGRRNGYGSPDRGPQ